MFGPEVFDVVAPGDRLMITEGALVGIIWQPLRLHIYCLHLCQLAVLGSVLIGPDNRASTDAHDLPRVSSGFDFAFRAA